MSWFNHKPRPKNPTHHLSPKHFSPATERKLEETKKAVRPPKEKK